MEYATVPYQPMTVPEAEQISVAQAVFDEMDTEAE